MRQNPKRKEVTFTFMYVPGKEVFVAGSFNKWDPKAIQLVDHDRSGSYTVTILLPKGRHEFKFFADENWQVDPFNSESVVNEYGSLNNVIVV